MSNGQNSVRGSVRPNIQITHALNGRVKDYAEEKDIGLSEAYRRVITVGVDKLWDEHDLEQVRERKEADSEEDATEDSS